MNSRRDVCHLLWLFFIHLSLRTCFVLDLRPGYWAHRDETAKILHNMELTRGDIQYNVRPWWMLWNKRKPKKTRGHRDRKWPEKGGSGTLWDNAKRGPLSRDLNEVISDWAGIWRRSIPGRRSSRCKAFETETIWRVQGIIKKPVWLELNEWDSGEVRLKRQKELNSGGPFKP